MVPKLPLEVQFTILSLLDCRKTTLECALVCKAWVPTARSLVLSTHKVEVLRASDPLKAPETFIDIITDPHCTIREALSQISICRVRDDVRRVEEDTSCERITNALIEHVPHIEGLTFYWTLGRPYLKLTPALNLLSSVSSSLKTLKLLHFDLWHLPTLLDALSSDAQCLTSLKILTFRPRDHEDSSIIFSAPPPSLQTVSTNVVTRSFLEQWLIPNASPIRRLDVQFQDDYAIEVMAAALQEKQQQSEIAQRFLCLEPLYMRGRPYRALEIFLSTPECSQSVNRWIFHSPEYFEQSDDRWDLDLSLATNLRSIEIIVPLGYFVVFNHAPIDRVLDPISQTLCSVPGMVAAELDIDLDIQLYENTGDTTGENVTSILDKMLDEFLDGVLGRTAGVVAVTIDCRWVTCGFPLCHARSQRTGNFQLELK